MVIVTTAVYWGLNSQLRSQRLLTGPLNLPAPGRRQSIYINLTSSHGPVFLINSRFPLFSATPQRLQPQRPSRREAPLLPKLRGHFAEFLNHSSPERLSIFNLTTCVGLGYGPYTHIARGFSRQYRITTINPNGSTHHASTTCAADLPTTRSARLHHQSNKWRGYLTASPHHLNHTSGPTTSTPPTLKESQQCIRGG